MSTDLTFRTVVIGSQEWMAENLNVPAEGSWVRGDDPEGIRDGRYYTWEAARRVSPPGWHLPTDGEWEELVKRLGGESVAGSKLKEGGPSGFGAKLRGNRTSDGTFEFAGKLSNFWTASEYDRDMAWCRFLSESMDRVGRDGANKRAGYAVRCVRNTTSSGDKKPWWRIWK